jgi:hypothetical protein
MIQFDPIECKDRKSKALRRSLHPSAGLRSIILPGWAEFLTSYDKTPKSLHVIYHGLFILKEEIRDARSVFWNLMAGNFNKPPVYGWRCDLLRRYFGVRVLVTWEYVTE